MSKLVDKAMLEKLALALYAKAKALVEAEATTRGAQDDLHTAAIEKLQGEMKSLLGEGEEGEDAGLIAQLNELIESKVSKLREEVETADDLLDGRIGTLESIVSGGEDYTLGELIEQIVANQGAIQILNGNEETDGSVAKAVKAEADRAKGVEEGLQGAIDALGEADEAQDALISANDAAIKAEAQAARAAEEALSNRIKAFEEGDNSVAKQIETLANRHDSEMDAVEDRVADVEAFESRIKANEDFVDAQPAVDKAQNDRMDGLEDRIEANETFVAAQPAIDLAQNNRLAALEEDVARLDGAVDVEGSVKKQIADAVKVEADRAAEAEGDLADRIKANEDKLAGLEKETVQAAIDQAEADAKAHAEQKIADLVDSAPDAMNTLNELAKAINDNKDIYDAYIDEHATAMSTMKTELQAEIDADVKVVADELAKQKDATQEGTLAKKIADEVTRADAEEKRIVGLVEAEATKAREEEGKLQGQINTINEKDLAQDGRLDTLEAAAGIGGEGKDKFAELQDAIDAVDDKVDEAQAAVDVIEERLDGKEGEVGIVGRIAALEAANAEGGAVASAISAAQAAADQAQREVDAVEERMTTAEADIDALEGKFTELVGADTGLQNQITQNKTDIGLNKAAVEAVAKDLADKYTDTEDLKVMIGNVVNSLGLALTEDNKLQLTLGGTGTEFVLKEVELELATEEDINAILEQMK